MINQPFHQKIMTPICLQQRLAQLTGHLVEINGANLGLEPGTLQRVFKSNFIQVAGIVRTYQS